MCNRVRSKGIADHRDSRSPSLDGVLKEQLSDPRARQDWETTRTHQPSAFLASPVTPAPDSRSTLSSAAATTPRADSRMPASHAITICSSAETPRKARPGLGRITVNTVLSVNECSLTCMSIDEDAPMAVDVLAMGISQSLEGHKGNVRQGAV